MCCHVFSKQATPGVSISVLGLPKDDQYPVVEFGHNNTQGGVTYKGGDWVTTNITLPPRGLGNLTFVYTVPMGFDDLSAAVSSMMQLAHLACTRVFICMRMCKVVQSALVNL